MLSWFGLLGYGAEQQSRRGGAGDVAREGSPVLGLGEAVVEARVLEGSRGRRHEGLGRRASFFGASEAAVGFGAGPAPWSAEATGTLGSGGS